MNKIESISIGIIILLIAFRPPYLKTIYKNNLGKLFLFVIFVLATLISRTIGISIAVLLLSLNVGVSEGFLTEEQQEEADNKQKQLDELKAIKEARKADVVPPVSTSQDEVVVDALSIGQPTPVVDANSPIATPVTDSSAPAAPVASSSSIAAAPVTESSSPVVPTAAVVPSAPSSPSDPAAPLISPSSLSTAPIATSTTKVEGFTSNSEMEKKVREFRNKNCVSGNLIGKDGKPINYDINNDNKYFSQVKDQYQNISFSDNKCNLCNENCNFILIDSNERITNEENMRPQPSNQTSIN